MDPTRCDHVLLDAWNCEEYETAREHAVSLSRWLGRGGYDPEGYPPADADEYLSQLLCETAKMHAIVEPEDDE